MSSRSLASTAPTGSIGKQLSVTWRGRLPRWLALTTATLLLLAIAVRLAWLGDDAYITLRSVENLVSGNGLRWNAAERVWINTHALWTLLLAGGRWLTGEVYFATIGISLLISTLATVLILRRATTGMALLAGTVVLASTRAFGEYSTSGLETPLTYLMLVLFFDTMQRRDLTERQRFARAVLLCAVTSCTRLDLGLLCVPAVLSTLRGVGVGAGLRLGLLASAPLLAWLVFAVIYFGFPLPVVASAKAFGGGIPAMEFVQQGLRYLQFAATDDPVLLATVATGITIGLLQAHTRWLAFGALLYLGYVVKVGGDFMAGRFCLPSFVIAIVILLQWLKQRGARSAAVVGLVALALLGCRGWPAWLAAPSSDTPPTIADIERNHGIVDERRLHYHALGLLASSRVIPQFGAMEAKVFPDGRATPWFLLNGAVGAAGYQMGTRGHVVDPILCDPLLARLPARDPKRWSIGHILRRIPEGYYESLATGENRLRHAGLRQYYDALRSLTRAPVFDRERLGYVVRMARGEFDDGLRAFLDTDYYIPPRVPMALAALPPTLPLGGYWFDEPRLCLVYDGGLSIGCGGQTHRAATLRLQALGAAFYQYRVRFLRDGPVVGEALGVPQPPPAALSQLQVLAGLCELLVTVPPGIEFDTLWIDMVQTPTTHLATGPAGIGAITFVP